MAEPTHRTGMDDGWKVAEFRIGDTWHRMGQRFSDNISEAEVDGFAWAAREGYLLATDPNYLSPSDTTKRGTRQRSEATKPAPPPRKEPLDEQQTGRQ